MSNPYFTKSGYPSSNARAVSATLRAEIAAIEAGFDKLPTFSGNANKVIAVNAGETALEPSTTPALGAATATSINKVTITAPATSATLTIANGKTLTASNTLTLTGTDGTSLNINAVTNLNSGTYTPVLTDIGGVIGSIVYDAFWVRIGSVVIVSGAVQVSRSGGSTAWSMTIPVASNFTIAQQLSGTLTSATGDSSGGAVAEVTANEVEMRHGVASDLTWYYTYMYVIV